MALYKRKYVYVDAAGLHFPDADAGDETYYSLDLTCLIETESETVTDVQWNVPKDITVVDFSIIDGKEAQVKLSTPIAGVFRIKADVSTVDTGRTSVNRHSIILKVI